MLLIIVSCSIVGVIVSTVTLGLALHVVRRLRIENERLQESVDYWFGLAVERADRESVDICLPDPPPVTLVFRGEHGFVVFHQ